jgi:hypothetical protein
VIAPARRERPWSSRPARVAARRALVPSPSPRRGSGARSWSSSTGRRPSSPAARSRTCDMRSGGAGGCSHFAKQS